MGHTYGKGYMPGDFGREIGQKVKADAIQEFKLALADKVVRMRPNQLRENGMVIRTQGGQRLNDPELMSIVDLRKLYTALIDEGYERI